MKVVDIADLCTRVPALSAWNLERLSRYDAAFQHACVLLINKKRLIDETAFWTWLDQYRCQDSAHAAAPAQ